MAPHLRAARVKTTTLDAWAPASLSPALRIRSIGHNTGEEFDVNVTFPEDYQAEELAGKDAVFKIKLHEIKAKELPEVDDDFVKDVSDFDTVEAYQSRYQRKADGMLLKTRAKDEVENQLIDKLVELVQGEIPEAMYENRINEDIRDFGYRLQSQGLNFDTYHEVYRHGYKIQSVIASVLRQSAR